MFGEWFFVVGGILGWLSIPFSLYGLRLATRRKAEEIYRGS